LRDILNSDLIFFPLTGVQVISFAGRNETDVAFVAVNKNQILFLEERNTQG